MGNLCGGNEGVDKSRLIDRRLTQAEDEAELEYSLVLLGTGNTGKTTFYRQLQIIHGNGVTLHEKNECRTLIHQSICKHMLTLCRVSELQSNNGFDMSIESIGKYARLKRAYEAADAEQRETSPPSVGSGGGGGGESSQTTGTVRVSNHSSEYGSDGEGIPLSSSLSGSDENRRRWSKAFKFVRSLWRDPTIKKVFEEFGQISQVPETMKEFWDDIDRIGRHDYVPTNRDVVLLRWPTSGASMFEFSYVPDEGGSVMFKIMDVGGQRCERRKWLHVFDSVDAILYVTSLTAYNEMLYEDNNTNAMDEQLQVIVDTLSMGCFWNTPIIFFMNKSDLIKSLIKRRPIVQYFSDFEGDARDPDLAIEHISSHILSQAQFVNGGTNRTIYSHVTCATNSKNVQNVFHDVSHAILHGQLCLQGLK